MRASRSRGAACLDVTTTESHGVELPSMVTTALTRSSMPSIRSQLFEIDGGNHPEVDACGHQLLGGPGGVDAAQHVAVAHWMQFRRAGGDHDVVGLHVQHVAVGEPDDHHWTRVDADHVVAQLGGQHRDIAALCMCRRGCGVS